MLRTSSSRRICRAALAAGGAGIACMALLAGPAGASAPAPEGVTAVGRVDPAAETTNPAEYAQAAFEAWQQGDIETLSELAEPSVVAFLAAHPPGTGSWGDPQCEGAAGSTYCAWAQPEVQLVLRVRNDLAAAGEPHAVIEASFETVPGRVAIWPFTTQDEADLSQEQVDEGHSPWLAVPEAVASFYALAELGWEDATVEALWTDRYRVTDPETGAQADLTLVQPVREGEGGIWAVTRAGSVPPS